MTPWLDDGDVRLYHGSALDVLAGLPAESVQTVVTSPPYWGLRCYGVDGQLGLEETPDAYVTGMVAVFRQVWRVLRADGTLWLNLGDSYNANTGRGFDTNQDGDVNTRKRSAALDARPRWGKPKNLVGIPWRVAFALQADGWYLRSDIIWAKPNPMPESVTDRPTKAHEYVFLLSKSARYYYDSDSIREAATADEHMRRYHTTGAYPDRHGEQVPGSGPHGGLRRRAAESLNGGRNCRSVWDIATQPTPEAHFATYPEELVRRCILAGTSEAGECSLCGAPWTRQVERTPMVLDRSERTHPMGRTRTSGTMLEAPTSTTTGWAPSCACGVPARPQTVLDPFVGSGTTALVARRHGRRAIGIDLNADYLGIAARRTAQQSLLAEGGGA